MIYNVPISMIAYDILMNNMLSSINSCLCFIKYVPGTVWCIVQSMGAEYVVQSEWSRSISEQESELYIV